VATAVHTEVTMRSLDRFIRRPQAVGGEPLQV
jgi:hypothetical protein